jgi:hypothetical protein
MDTHGCLARLMGDLMKATLGLLQKVEVLHSVL